MYFQIYWSSVALGAVVFGPGVMGVAKDEGHFSVFDLIKASGLIFGAPLTVSIWLVEHAIRFINDNFRPAVDWARSIHLWHRA